MIYYFPTIKNGSISVGKTTVKIVNHQAYIPKGNPIMGELARWDATLGKKDKPKSSVKKGKES